MSGTEGGASGDGPAAAEGGTVEDKEIHREASTGSSADIMIPRMSSSGTAGSFMLMGEGSSRVVPGGQSVWPSVVEVEGGRESLLAECFRAMQRYQTLSARLQMRLENLTKCAIPPHVPSTQGSASHTPSIEMLQPPPPVEPPEKPRPGSAEDSAATAKKLTARGTSPMRARASSMEVSSSPKPALRTSSSSVSETDGMDLARKVEELTEELDAQKQRVFEASAQLRSFRVENRMVQRQNQSLVAELLAALGPEKAEALTGREEGPVTLGPGQCASIRQLLKNLKRLQADDDEGALSGEDAAEEGDWRPYVTQAHPGTATSASGAASPVQTSTARPS